MVVTLLEHAGLTKPMRVADEVILEPGSPVVWFTFPNKWHDIGRFHLADGTFTGLYANVLTPVVFEDRWIWQTNDLFLDIWLTRSGQFHVLDTDELAAAAAAGSVSADLAQRARQEVEELRRDWQRGRWPPALVHEWSLERAREFGARAQ
ncbi:MAG: DUF402 domain-containing protein [Longimicrobiales bacterium]